MTDSPSDPPPWQQGPPEGYNPPPVDTLTDPAVHEHTHTTGRDLVLAVLADSGIRKTENGWTTPNSERKTP